MKVKMYTDGACSGNPGPGGYACLLALPEGQVTKSGGEELTTNNCMELKAVIIGLLELTKTKYYGLNLSNVEIISDSAYVVNAINQKWLAKWKKNGWKTTKGEDVKNCKLWKELIAVLNIYKTYNIKITFVKVKGHADNTFNEYVDKLAKKEVQTIKN
jgi:ribonuclease HI